MTKDIIGLKGEGILTIHSQLDRHYCSFEENCKQRKGTSRAYLGDQYVFKIDLHIPIGMYL
jgi:hypothetical protein